MDTTVQVGDHLLVDKLSYAPPGALSKHLLPYTESSVATLSCSATRSTSRRNYVKRVMGIPGDHLRLVNKGCYLNGKGARGALRAAHARDRSVP
jgi:signal peptidase I